MVIETMVQVGVAWQYLRP